MRYMIVGVLMWPRNVHGVQDTWQARATAAYSGSSWEVEVQVQELLITKVRDASSKIRLDRRSVPGRFPDPSCQVSTSTYLLNLIPCRSGSSVVCT